ncbi:MAG: GNAT family N-acetyltransferase [Candidatus Glassbacteria bacterium]
MSKAEGSSLSIRRADSLDVPLILSFIKELAEYERLSPEVVATEEMLSENLFGKKRYAEVLIGYYQGEAAGFAIYFHNFSTFVSRPGIYLEDIYVRPEYRGKGLGKALLIYIARLAKERNCGRLEWSVLDWNEPAIRFYKNLGARAMEDWTVYRVSGEPLERLAEIELNL